MIEFPPEDPSIRSPCREEIELLCHRLGEWIQAHSTEPDLDNGVPLPMQRATDPDPAMTLALTQTAATRLISMYGADEARHLLLKAVDLFANGQPA